MRIVIAAVSASIAAGAAGAAFDRWLASQPEWVWWVSIFAIFVVAFGLAWVLSGLGKAERSASVASRNQSSEGMKVRLEDLDIATEGSSEVASGNRSGGDMSISAKGMKIRK